MKVEELKQLADKCLSNKNYQHTGKSWHELDGAAIASWNKLTPAQKLKVVTVAQKYGIVEDTDLTNLIRWRYLAQTNLFFLCKLLERYKDVSEKEYIWTDGKVHNVHEEICNEFFVQKDPTKHFKAFATEYVGFKERLLLVPRGGFKSSMDMADTVQWIISFPEITILILTGVLDLAKDFVSEIKNAFILEDTGETEMEDLFHSKKLLRPRTMSDGTPNLFQVLFAEHCIPMDDGKATEFQTPASAIIQKEPTVFAASIEQNLAGWHVSVMKLDDVVTNENSRTAERIKNINKQVSINKAMLHPYGFYDKIGTWYDQGDTYGQDIKNEEKRAKAGVDPKQLIYIRAAWWPTQDAAKQGKVEDEMVESDYVLWFPADDSGTPQLTYKKLVDERHDDPEGFAIKYLNDPTQAHRIKFPRELLLRRTIPANQLPHQGMIVTCIDTAYSTKSWSDFTVIITALIYGGRFYVIDMKRGRWNEYELPMVIAAAANQWRPRRICIEESVGVKWLGKEIYREMDKFKIRVPLEFVPLGQGSKKTSKDWKAKPVLRLLGDERLLIANQCPGLEEIYSELEKFGTAAATHDDIVSALSILVEQFASYADMEGKRAAAQSDFVPDIKQAQFYEQVYGADAMSKVYTQKSLAAALASDPEQPIQEALVNEQKEAAAYYDPLSELF